MQVTIDAPPWHTLVHIGAGHGQALPRYREAGLERLVLIEPLPQLAETLSRAVKGLPNAEVWELAVAVEQGHGELIEYNWADASSLHAPTDLYDLFPGLKPVSRHEVKCISPDELMEKLDLDDDGQHLLVVEANGDEGAILQAWMQDDRLARFAHLEIALPHKPLYADSLGAEVLLPSLEEYGYSITERDSTNPDMPRWQLVLEYSRRELRQVKRELEAERQARQQTETETHQLSKQLKAEQDKRQETDAARQSLAKQHDELKAQHKNECKKLTKTSSQLAERDKALSSAQAELEACQAKITQHEKSLEQKNRNLEDAQHALAKQQEQMPLLEKQQASLEAELKEKRQCIEMLDQEGERLKAQSQSRFEQLNEQKSHVARLETENQQLQQRQDLMQEDLVKAEAQIELIKDLTLRESSL